MPRKPDLTVLVVVKNGAAHMSHIVETIDRVSEANRRRTELLIVVDPTTDDDTIEVANEAAARSDVTSRVELGTEPGLAAGWNSGHQRATGDYLVRWDAHGRYTPELIESYFKKYIDDGGLDAHTVVGGPVLLRPATATTTAAAVAAADRSRLFSGAAGKAKREPVGDDVEVVEFVARYLCHRDVYDVVGDYLTLPWACEDTEWAARARRLGVRLLLDPELISLHSSRDTISGFATQKYRNGAANGYFLLGRGTATGGRKAVAVSVALSFMAVSPLLPRRLLQSLIALAGLSYPVMVASEWWQLRTQTMRVDPIRFGAAALAGHAGFGIGVLRGAVRAAGELVHRR